METGEESWQGGARARDALWPEGTDAPASGDGAGWHLAWGSVVGLASPDSQRQTLDNEAGGGEWWRKGGEVVDTLDRSSCCLMLESATAQAELARGGDFVSASYLGHFTIGDDVTFSARAHRLVGSIRPGGSVRGEGLGIPSHHLGCQSDVFALLEEYMARQWIQFMRKFSFAFGRHVVAHLRSWG